MTSGAGSLLALEGGGLAGSCAKTRVTVRARGASAVREGRAGELRGSMVSA